MNWIKIVLISLFSLGGLSSITSVGQEKKPITPKQLVFIIICDILIILGIIYA